MREASTHLGLPLIFRVRPLAFSMSLVSSIHVGVFARNFVGYPHLRRLLHSITICAAADWTFLLLTAATRASASHKNVAVEFSRGHFLQCGSLFLALLGLTPCSNRRPLLELRWTSPIACWKRHRMEQKVQGAFSSGVFGTSNRVRSVCDGDR